MILEISMIPIIIILRDFKNPTRKWGDLYQF